MKKMGFLAGMAAASIVGLGTYALVNKNTKNKADKLINNFLDKANNMTNNMMK